MIYVALHSYATFTNFVGYLDICINSEFHICSWFLKESREYHSRHSAQSFSSTAVEDHVWYLTLFTFCHNGCKPLRKLLGVPETTASAVQLQVFFCKSLNSPHLHLTMYPQDAAHTEVLQCLWMLLLRFGLLQPLPTAASARRWIWRNLRGWFWWPAAGASSKEQTEVNTPAVFSDVGPSFLS